MDIATKAHPGYANAAIFDDPLAISPKEVFEFTAGCSVNKWLDDSGFRKILHITPTLVLLNNKALLEAEFDTVIKEHDVITLTPQPGITGVEIAMLVGFIVSVVSTGYALYLALTIDTPDAGGEAQSSTYNISYRSNHKRPGQPIPVAYGKCRVYPDLSSEIWSEYDQNGDQIKVMLFEFTQGQADVTDMRFEETPLSSYSQIDMEVLQPGVPSTIYPFDVNNVSNVQNIELDITDSTAYAICEEGQLAGLIYLDFVAPQGLWTRSETTGNYFAHTVNLIIEYRVFGSGSAWAVHNAVAAYSRDPWRATVKVGLLPNAGRYEIKVRRAEPRINEARTADAVFWTGLRAFIIGNDAPQTTRVAIRIRASNQTSNLSLSQFSGVVHRKLPTYISPGVWSSPVLTTSPVWAFCDACMAIYGGKRIEAYLDMNALALLDESLLSKPEIQFNGIFETAIPLWQALQEIARVMLARPIELPGGVYTMVVDEKASGPSAMFTMANIVAGSFKLDHVGYRSDTNDSVVVTYKDEAQEYRDNSVSLVPDQSAGTNPAERSIRGATSLRGASIIGWRMANENRFRRINATWRTGLEGYVPIYGDTVRVQHWMLGVNLGVSTLSGSIVSRSGSTMYVNEDLSGIGGSGQCWITGDAGGVSGPHGCSVSANSFTVSGDTSHVTFSDDLQRPQFIVGKSGDFVQMIKLVSVQNVGEHEYELTGFLDNPNAYIEDDVPTGTTLNAAQKLTPTIEDLRYTLDGQEHQYDLRLSWREINVDRSQVEQSTDNGVTYGIVDEQAHQSYVVIGLDGALVNSGNLWYRVTGFNIGPGPVATINIVPQAYIVAPPTGVTVASEFILEAHIKWDIVPMNHRVKVYTQWDGTLQRTAILDRAITEYRYTWWMSVEDQPGSYLGVEHVDDGARDITFFVSALDDGDNESDPIQVGAYNWQNGAIADVQYWELVQGGLRIKYKNPGGDFYGVEIHLSTEQGFTPDMAYPSTTRKYAGSQDDVTIAGALTYPDTWYLRMAQVDWWGRDNIVWSQETAISTIDGITQGTIEWSDIISAFGIQMNVSTFNGSSNPGYFYIHGYTNGVAADIPVKILCDNTVFQIPAMDGSAHFNGTGYLAWDTQGRNYFLVDGQNYNLAFVVYYGSQWYFDSGAPFGAPLLFDPPAEGLFIIGEIQVANNTIVSVFPYTAGKTPEAVVASDFTAWDDINARPNDADLLNIEQVWADINNKPDDIYNDNLVWGNMDDLINTGGRLYNEDTTWVNLGDPDTGTPEEILNSKTLEQGHLGAPDGSDIYNNQQLYADITNDLKPPTNATQNGQRGLSWDPDFGLSHANVITDYYPVVSSGVTTSGSSGENGTAAGIITANGTNRYIGSQRIPARQGDRFYVMARVKLSSSSIYSGCFIYAEEYNGNTPPGVSDGHSSLTQGAPTETSSWQTVLYTVDIQHPATHSVIFYMYVGSGVSSGSMTVDSYDFWPITVKWSYPNIAYYIDNLAIRNALIGNGEITNLKIRGDALFLTGHETYLADTSYNYHGNNSDLDDQAANWQSFASFFYDLDGLTPGQSLNLEYIRSQSLTFKFDRNVDRVWLDMRIICNGIHVNYIFSADWYFATVGGILNVDNPAVANREYEAGTPLAVYTLNAPAEREIEENNTVVFNPIIGINQIEIQFRFITTDTGLNPTACTIDWKYGTAWGVFSIGRSTA